MDYHGDFSYNDAPKTPRETRKTKLQKATKRIPRVALAVLIIIVLLSSFTIVPSGYTGIRTTFGQISPTPVNGFSPKVPFVQDIVLVNNKQQNITITERVWSESSDQTVVFMENTQVTYQISAEKSPWVYCNVHDYENNLIDASTISSALKASSVQLPTNQVTHREKIEPIAKTEVQRVMDEKYGPGVVTIVRVTISNIDFEESYNDAIAKRQIAQQEYEQAKIDNKTKIELAEAEAEAERARAQGEADAELIRAQAKADANKIISESITGKTIQQDALDKWDGKLPAVSSGGNNLLIDPSSFIGTSGSETTN